MTSGSRQGRGGARGRFARGHPVPLRRQLAAALEAAIRDGHLPPGDRLPSTRDLARRLGVHRSTVNAAYARLRRRGCVEGKERGRLAVGGRGAWPTPDGLAGSDADMAIASSVVADCVYSTLRRAAAAGIPRHAVVLALGRTAADLGGAAPTEPAVRPDDGPRAGSPPRPERVTLVLVEPRPGLRRALAAELERRLGVAVVQTRALPRDGRTGPVLARPETLARLGANPRRGGAVSGSPTPGGLELLPLPLAGGTRERGLVRRSVRGGVVALVSVSASIRRYARELAAREFARGVSFTAVDPRDRAAVIRAVGVARLVLHDDASRDALPDTSVPAVAIRLIPPGPIVALRGYLGVDPGSRDPRRGT